MHVWLLRLDLDPTQLLALERVLDPTEHARAARFHFPRDRHRFVAARGQLRHVLAAYAGMPPQRVEFGTAASGKPHLVGQNRAVPLEFNLSHSDSWALLGVTTGLALGVDIEAAVDLPDLDEVAREHFAATEIAELRQLPPYRRLDGFYACWTRKEAFIKATGDGLSMPLDRFEVAIDPDRPAHFRSIDGSAEAAAAWTLWAAEPLPNYFAAIAAEATGLTFELRQVAGAASQEA